MVSKDDYGGSIAKISYYLYNKMGCIDSQTATASPRPPPRRPSQAPRPTHAYKKRMVKIKTAKDTRLKTKYRKEDIMLVSDEDRR